MTEQTIPPTFFGNIMTAHVNVDEVSFEVRRLMPTHSQISEMTKGGTEPMKPLTELDIYALAPIVKVVVTFSAAKALSDNLQSLIAQMAEARKRGA